MKLNRRELIAAAALASRTQPCPAQEADPIQAARDANRGRSETLAKFEVPMSTEPAFQFKA
jgi:hypothetical protein